MALSAERRRHALVELAEAQAYWARRALSLGITRTTSPPQQLARAQGARQARVTQGPGGDTVPAATRETKRLTTELRTLEKLAAALKIERAIEERYAAMGTPRPDAGVQRMEKLLATVGDPLAAQRALANHERSQSPPALQRPPAVTKKLQEVLTRLGHEDHTGAGAALNVRLHDEDERRKQAQHHGMSF
jgi:hypothetical protein